MCLAQCKVLFICVFLFTLHFSNFQGAVWKRADWKYTNNSCNVYYIEILVKQSMCLLSYSAETLATTNSRE